MMIVIVEKATRSVLVLNPPMWDGAPILPEGVDCEVMELSDADAALIGATNARYSVDAAGRLVVTPVAETPALPTIEEQIAALQAAVLDLALGGV